MFFAQTSALCDKAIAISRSTRADARWLCALPQEDVVVSYPGPSLCVHDHACTASVCRRDNVWLVVSTLEPRKNASFLLNWFLTTSVLPAQAELWWVGPRGWLHQGIRRMPRSPYQRRVRFLGMVTDRRLCQAYRQARCTIYPSLYEGFGFPVLDSLWHGTPSLCSFNSSLQEFAGPGVSFFDACSPTSLDEACARLLAGTVASIDHAALARRFSWDRFAQTVLELCA
jgi:glycosyltransferase involved in cell wall biosynthesis